MRPFGTLIRLPGHSSYSPLLLFLLHLVLRSFDSQYSLFLSPSLPPFSLICFPPSFISNTLICDSLQVYFDVICFSSLCPLCCLFRHTLPLPTQPPASPHPSSGLIPFLLTSYLSHPTTVLPAVIPYHPILLKAFPPPCTSSHPFSPHFNSKYLFEHYDTSTSSYSSTRTSPSIHPSIPSHLRTTSNHPNLPDLPPTKWHRQPSLLTSIPPPNIPPHHSSMANPPHPSSTSSHPSTHLDNLQPTPHTPVLPPTVPPCCTQLCLWS